MTEYDDIKRRYINGQDGDLRPRTLFWRDLVEFPEPDYLIKGVLVRGSIVEIYGPHGSGKSFFACDLGLHIATGRSWRGWRTKQAGVLYVSAEGGTNITRRLKAFAKRHPIDLAKLPFGVVIAPTNLLEPEGIMQIIADAKAVRDIGIVIIDTAARTMPGGREDTEDMGLFVAALDAIRDATGATLMAIHHTGKNAERGSRGSNRLPDAADAIIAVSKNEKIFTAEIEKARDGEIGATFAFTLDVVELGVDEEGDPITSCVIVPGEDGTAAKKRAKLTGAAKVGLDQLLNCIAIRGEPLPASDHVPEGVRGVTLKAWRGYLEQAGVINAEGNPREQFRRIRVTLQDRGFIGVWSDFAWPSHAVTSTSL